MTEPSRKKVKGFAESTQNLQLVQDTRASAELIFETNHDNGSVQIDLTQFAEGTTDSNKYPLIQNRFHGRPQLITQLAPHIRRIVSNKSAKTASLIIAILRKWWVFFDKLAAEHSVQTLTDIDDFVGLKQYHEQGLRGNFRTDFLRAVNYARNAKQLPALYWPSPDEETQTRSLPRFDDIKTIYHELKQNVKSVVANWERADSLSLTGTDWSGGLRARHSKVHGYWTEGDTHATYRGAIARLGCPTPKRLQMAEILQRPNSQAVLKMVDALHGLYPRQKDVQYMLYLFLLRTGWNATTALELDVSSCISPHPTSKDHHVIRSIKKRGNTEQGAIGLNKSQFSPGNILKLLIDRTKPLRNYLELELSSVETQLLQTGDKDVLENARELRRMVRTPWLHVTRHGGIGYLTEINYLIVVENGASRSGLKHIIDKINNTRIESTPVENITVGDFRDAYISFAYETSGYSWLVAKLAAGHSSIESLRSYLKKRHWKAHGEKKVHAWGEAFWSEIKVHRSVDPAILFARVQRGEISDEERTRWLRRTHVGTGCENPTHPPDYVAPEHVPNTNCRVQRCTLCHHAILFDDSYDLLSRRLVELEHLHISMPLLAWMQSSFPLEMENTKRALKQFSDGEVEERKRHWEEEIKSGRYIPIKFEGSY